MIIFMTFESFMRVANFVNFGNLGYFSKLSILTILAITFNFNNLKKFSNLSILVILGGIFFEIIVWKGFSGLFDSHLKIVFENISKQYRKTDAHVDKISTKTHFLFCFLYFWKKGSSYQYSVKWCYVQKLSEVRDPNHEIVCYRL